jgi:hypothetical protein
MAEKGMLSVTLSPGDMSGLGTNSVSFYPSPNFNLMKIAIVNPTFNGDPIPNT